MLTDVRVAGPDWSRTDMEGANMTTRFDGMDLAKAQELYRKLILENHPDRGGDPEEAKAINAEWQAFTAKAVNEAFANMDGKTGDNSADAFAEILRTVSRMNVRAEIIGFWIYAFQSYEYREQLKELGFWFSAKHRAWIYSGGRKRPIRGRYTTDENRARWGVTVIQHVEPDAETLLA